MSATYTVLGARGFIGSRVAARIRAAGRSCWTPERGEASLLRRRLGHVICCVGLTADYRDRPYDAVRAHVGFVAEILERATFDSFLYLSSTRLYAGCRIGTEAASLRIGPDVDLYDASKLLGEALCLSTRRAAVRVARLSNVYGDDADSPNFLPSLIRDAVDRGRVLLKTSYDSAKDYVGVEDVADVLPRLAAKGRRRLYNVAGGRRTSNRSLAEALRRVTGCRVMVERGAPTVRYPPIRIDRIRSEFNFEPGNVLDDIEGLIAGYRRGRKAT